MRCQQCQFENIPGQKRCLRCNALLEDEIIGRVIYPPRMPRWKGPIRAMFRFLRKVLPENVANPKIPAAMRIMSGDAFLGLFLSIIPGLAHLVDGRFREVRWTVLIWFVVLAGGIFFYGGNFGLLLLGLAVGIHAWIAMHHKLDEQYREIERKIINFTLLAFFLTLFYWGIRRIVFGDFMFRYSNLDIPSQNVHTGDLLLGRRSRANIGTLRRGSLVFTRLRRIAGGHFSRHPGSTVVVQVVGLGGERVKISEGTFFVNDEALNQERYPVPQWLLGRVKDPIWIPDGSYFVNAVYTITVVGNAAVNNGMVKNACIIEPNDIEAEAIMLWLPLGRRGFLEADE